MYSAEINRNNPALILFLIDCSFSMSQKYGSTKLSKGQYLARITNDSIDQIILSCEKGDEIRAYFEIGVLGYGDKAEVMIPVQSIIELANSPKEMVKTTLDGIEVEKPVWLGDPTREVDTDMKAGFKLAAQELKKWTADHKASFPPVLIHVSDGEWTTESPVATAHELQQDVFTDDGPCIVMNIHISNENSDTLTFPDREPAGSTHVKGLFQMSSVLPDSFLNRAKERYGNVLPGARAYIYNADPEDLTKFFDIGTRLRG